jgi:hypothetical protein
MVYASPENISPGTLVWESSDTNVATVDENGTVTGITNGEVDITAQAGNGVKGSIHLVFVQPLVSLTLSTDVAGPVAGVPLTIHAFPVPYNAVIGSLVWESSDPSVATVNGSGSVTGKKNGEVDITARTTNGVEGVIHLSFILPEVTAIEITEGNRKLFVGDDFQFHVGSAPVYSVVSVVEWNSSNPLTVSIDETGKATALEIGSAIITATDGTHTDQILVSSFPVMAESLDPLPDWTFPDHDWVIEDLLEKPGVEPPGDDPEMRVLSERWIELNMTEMAFDPETVGDTSRFEITSTDDPFYFAPVNPVRIQHRYFPERAPFTPSPAAAAKGQAATDGQSGYIVVVYRIFIKVPIDMPLAKGCTYMVSVDGTTVPGLGVLMADYDGKASKEIIHVNQEAYPPVGPKIACLSAWLGANTVGNKGYMDFTTNEHPDMDGHFYVVSEDDNSVVYMGNIVRSSNTDEDYYSGSQVYLLDFSECTSTGRYHLSIPGIGDSSPFSLGNESFNPVIYTIMRVLTHSRDGDHGLDFEEVTRWNRPPAHLDDAIEESTGERVDLTGGHMDAGDREKIPVNMAMAISYLVSASRLFPDQVESLGESLQIPESGNGVPDYLDELFWEADCLYRMVANTHQGGAMTAWVKPPWDGFEKGQPLEGVAGRIWFDKRYGRQRYSTLTVCGALAMAANDPLVKKYDPVRADAYLKAAKVVWNTYTMHEYDESWWSDSTGGGNGLSLGKHLWSSELIFAAANLYEATGKTVYLQYLQNEWPDNAFDLILYGIDAGGLPYQDYLCVALSTQPGMPAELKNQARSYILQVTDFINTQPKGKPVFGISYQEAVEWAVGWFFSGLRMGWPNLVAWGVSGDTKYRDHVIDTWNYLLGTNPLSMSHITGLGDPATRVRWPVHEIWDYAWRLHENGLPGGWVEPPPGLIVGDLQNGLYNYWFDSTWNSGKAIQMEPTLNQIPLFYRHVDGWVVYNEASFYTATTMAAIALPFVR